MTRIAPGHTNNALKHGLYACAHRAADAERDAITGVTDTLTTDFRPTGRYERALVARMAVVIWRLEQTSAMETAIWETAPASRVTMRTARALGRVANLEARLLGTLDAVERLLARRQALRRRMRKGDGQPSDDSPRDRFRATGRREDHPQHPRPQRLRKRRHTGFDRVRSVRIFLSSLKSITYVHRFIARLAFFLVVFPLESLSRAPPAPRNGPRALPAWTSPAALPRLPPVLTFPARRAPCV